MFVPIRVRMKIALLLQSVGLSGTPQKGSGSFLSTVYHEGVSENLPYIKKMKLNSEHAAYFVIYSVLCVFKARKSGGGQTTPDLLKEQYKYENLYAANNDYEMDLLQNSLQSKYGNNIPWNSN